MDIIRSLIYMTCEMAPYILLGLFIAGLLHAFVTPDLMGKHLARPGWKSVLKAALIGVPLPLCSCGVLPTAIALRRNGASKSATSAFLISTPQTGVDSIAATWSLLGPAFAILRPVAAMTTALAGGMAVSTDERSDTDGRLMPYYESDGVVTPAPAERSVMSRIGETLRYGFYDMVRSIGGWLAGGLLIAALITEFVPTDFFASLGRYPLLAMLAVVAVAVPMYVCATGSIPIALSLMLKGLSPGTALVLLMAGPAANFASITLLTRELGRRAAAIYIGSIVAGAILFGLAVDYLMPREWFPSVLTAHGGSCHAGSLHAGTFSAICAVILAVLLLIAFISRLFTNNDNKTNDKEMTTEFIVRGMSCPHCQKHVHNAVAAVAGVESVKVNLSTGHVTVEGTPNMDAVFAAVTAAGYDPSAL